MSKPISELPEFLKDFFFGVKEALYLTAENIAARMAQPGKERAPGERVNWDSPRQRKAFFASEGFGHGIPYVRTERYQTSIRATRMEFGARYSAPHPAGAIGGTTSGWQSNIHRNRWPYLLQVLFEELGKLPQEISDKFKAVGSE